MQLPKMYPLQQTFSRPRVEDIARMTQEELFAIGFREKIQNGQKIGITVGSRGIQNLQPILQTIIRAVREQGASPFLVAAMGSHGGGTEAGQMELLDSLGITEAMIGAPIITCTECQEIAISWSGLPVYTLMSALQMDGLFIVNRVKTHTSFKGSVESGLVKKLVVGLGGPKGAQQFHSFGPAELSRLLLEIGEAVLNSLPVLGGLAIVENAYEETALLKAMSKEQILLLEPEMLAYSKSLMPSLPVSEIDLLIIEEMGKNFSGTGIDTNIIGRARIQGVPEPNTPSIKRIAVLDLSEESHGNATGIGMADFVTQRLVDKMDRQATYLNCLTSTFVVRAAIPMFFDTDEKLFEAALYSLCSIPPEQLRIVMVPNTLFLADCLVSEAIHRELQGNPRMKQGVEGKRFEFDAAGYLRLSLTH